MRNPWLGLSSYTESSVSEYQFNGRSRATAVLADMIRRNLFVTLYGRSGIGKTSLLQAGVFPILRAEHMIPVPVRLNEVKDTGRTAAEIIWHALTEVLDKAGYSYEPCDSDDVYEPDYRDTAVLLKLFSAGRFTAADGTQALPVIVLDQFEEVLYTAPEASRLLVSQLYALIDDSYNLGIAHPHWHDETNFRIVVSIREDDIFMLEDVIDRLNCTDLKANRYRLMPLSEAEAREVILGPAPELFAAGTRDAVADGIIALARDSRGNINTLMLSLICYVLYNDSNGGARPVTPDRLRHYSDIIRTYYLEVVKTLPKKQRYYLEDNLVDARGRRKSVYLDDLERHAPLAAPLYGHSSLRILNNDQGRIEFVHDQLAATVDKIRTERKSQRTRKIVTSLLVFGLLAILLFSISHLPDYTNVNETSVDKIALHNNVRVRTYTIDSLGQPAPAYEISDCPNLKTIVVQRPEANLNIANCPNLVNIELPEFYSGTIYIYGCRNLREDNVFIRDDRYTIKSPTEYGYSRDDELYGDSQDDDVSQQSLRNDEKMTYMRRPVYYPYSIKINGVEYKLEGKLYTGIQDSLKTYTDLLVPWGLASEFSQLEGFKPFRSIEELPVYYNWMTNIREFYAKFSNAWVAAMAAVILLCVYLLFVQMSYKSCKPKYDNTLAGYAEAYAEAYLTNVDVLLIFALAFLAIYSLVYIILLPGNMLVACLCGIVAGAFSLFFTHNSTIHMLIVQARQQGISEMAKSIRRVLPLGMHTLRRLIDRHGNKVAVLLVLTALVAAYIVGYDRREQYIAQLQQIDMPSKQSAIAKAVMQQHGSILYPAFNKSLQEILSDCSLDDGKRIAHIDRAFLRKLILENEHGKSHDIFANGVPYGNFIVWLSEDLNHIFLTENTSRYMTLCFIIDLKTEDVTSVSIGGGSVNDVLISPDNRYIVVYKDNGIYVYSANKNDVRYLPLLADNRGIDDMEILKTTLCFVNGDALYTLKIFRDDPPKKVADLDNYGCTLARIDDHRVLIGDKYLMIYDIREDSITYKVTGPVEHHSQYQTSQADRAAQYADSSDIYQNNATVLCAATEDYAITIDGVIDLHNGKYVSHATLAGFTDKKPVYLDYKDDNLRIFSLQGKQLYEIKNATRAGLSQFSADGRYLALSNENAIDIYRLDTSAPAWPLTPRERRLFDLP